MSTVGQRLSLPRAKNTLCRDGVDISELLDHLTWLGMLRYRWQASSDPSTGVRLQIFPDRGGIIIGITGVGSLTVEGPTLYSCIGIVRTRIEKKKAELLASSQMPGLG